jgi:hypothetical protein
VITSASGWPSTFPFSITIDRDGANEEHILIGGRSGTTLTTLTRDWEDTGTTGSTHSAGESVEVTLSAKVFTDLGGILQVTAAGDLVYYDGSSFQKLAKSAKAQRQMLKSGTTPAWDWPSPPVYASTSARTTDNASPATGDSSYINSGDSAEGLYYYHGSAWALPWNMPWGVVASASSTSSQTGIAGSMTDITFATATWTGVAGRLYEITSSVTLLQVTSTGTQAVLVVPTASGAGGFLAESTFASVIATNQGGPVPVAYHTGTGSLSAHLRATTSAGTITIDNATMKGWFVVKDVGPTAGPP